MTDRLGATTDRLGEAAEPGAMPAGVRVVLDARPIQEADRAPTTAIYLRELLTAFGRAPVAGESFALLLRSDLDDPTAAIEGLDVIGRRLLPPTRLLRTGTLTVDPFLLGGASVGAAWRAERSGAAGAVFHAAAGTLPVLTGLPTVATVLDLAPWELAPAFQRGAVARFGQRFRARLLRDAAAVIVGTDAVADAVHRRLRIRPGRIRVVPLAPRRAFRVDPTDGARATHLDDARRLGLPERYLVYPGRYDARQDLATLLAALGRLAAAGRPDGLDEADPWPPRVLLVGASPDDRAAIARAAARHGAGDALAYAPALDPERLAGLVRGARAAVLPVLSEAAGLAAIEAIACGVPVVASAVGALPEIVGAAGLIVEPRDVDRLAVALTTVATGSPVHDRLTAAALDRARAASRTWDDVARETRAVYADVARPAAAD